MKSAKDFMVKEVDWWADTDERRRRDAWRDGPTEKSLRE